MAMLEEEQPAGIPEWVVTFGDMMSLLLTFFIMLVSLSEIKQKEQFQAMAESFQRRFGHETAVLSLVPGRSKPRTSAMGHMAVMGRARRADTMNGGDKVKAPVGEHPRVQAIRPGEEATRGGGVSFAGETATLTEEQKQTLQATAEMIGGKPQKIEIRGHTSSRPLSPDSAYASHWDLAYDRCRNVMEFLVGLGIDPKRMRVAVAADNEPAYIGTDPELQDENARVEVYMLNELTQELEGTAAQRQRRYSDVEAPE